MRLVFKNGLLMEEGKDYRWRDQYGKLAMNCSEEGGEQVQVVCVDEVPVGPYEVNYREDLTDEVDELQDEFDYADVRGGLSRALLRGIEIGRARAARNG